MSKKPSPRQSNNIPVYRELTAAQRDLLNDIRNHLREGENLHARILAEVPVSVWRNECSDRANVAADESAAWAIKAIHGMDTRPCPLYDPDKHATAIS